MADFNIAIKTVLEHEGGWTDDPNDAGGPTHYGITLPVLRAEGDAGDIDRDGDIDVEDIRQLTPQMAQQIYRAQWWERYGYGRIDSQAIATKIFDLAVNMGARQAHMIAQRALAANGMPVAVDGVLGPITRNALNAAPVVSLLAAIRSEAAGVYRLILARHPDYQTFEVGWLRRAYS